MACNLFFSRDTKVFLKQGSNIWELPILNGYTFSQTTNASTVTVSEMSDLSGNSRRGQMQFSDSLSPAEWSFDIYARPTLVTGTPNKMVTVEEALWANFVGQNAYTAGSDSWAVGVTRTATELDFDFADSNKSTLGEFELYFVYGANKVVGRNYTAGATTTIYKLTGCVVNEATMNFEIDGIATISWSGMGAQITELASFDASTAIVRGITDTTNLIRNRLTALAAVSSVSGSSVTYDIVLTGGSITISNNITFLTPETMGIVNTPLGHVTGSRSVSGNFTCYLDEAINGSIDLYEDLLGATTVVTNAFALDFYVGGKDSGGDTPNGPGVQFKLGQCHLEIPSITNDDVIGLEVNFTALPTTVCDTDEISRIRYVGV